MPPLKGTSPLLIVLLLAAPITMETPQCMQVAFSGPSQYHHLYKDIMEASGMEPHQEPDVDVDMDVGLLRLITCSLL